MTLCWYHCSCLSLVTILLWELTVGFEVKTVKNFRPVFPADPSCRLFRSASLDELSTEDAQILLDQLGSDLTVIDLRNQDEIDKQTRTDGSLYFYDQITSDGHPHHIPILRDVNAFWDEAIDRMDGWTKTRATLQTITQAGALDRAAARMLEDNGLSMLYTIMLATAGRPLRRTLEVCADARGSVIFHCQKGKDRTGVVAMLLQHCHDVGADEYPTIITRMSDRDIIDQYAMSGELLGETTAAAISSSSSSKTKGTMLDWSKFRGSPPSAMEETLEWIRQRYGSVVDGYLVNNLRLDPATIDKLQAKRSVELLSSSD